jgi:hypothetical protein
MEVPIGWFLATIASLAGAICTLAAVIFSTLNGRISSQSKIITDQSVAMEGMRKDIERLSDGCGVPACMWGTRRPGSLAPVHHHPEA